jgi:hybrid cluster-associated redox disulfide protein
MAPKGGQPMNDPWTFDPDMPVDTIMRNWPATVRVMMDHRMLCVGCPIAIFHTVTEACLAHGIDEESFVAALERAVQRQDETSAAPAGA